MMNISINVLSCMLLGKAMSFYYSCKWIKQITAGGAFAEMPFSQKSDAISNFIFFFALNNNSNQDFSYTGGTVLQLIPVIRVLVYAF